MMIQEPAATQLDYIGRQAIFDPTFIPPKVVMKKNVVDPLSKVLCDALEEKYGIFAMLYGLEGMGKHLFSVKTLEMLKGQLARKVNHHNDFQVITLDCLVHKAMNLIYHFAQILLTKHDIPFSIPILRTLGPDQICNLIQFCLKNQASPLIVILLNADDLPLPIYQKMADLNRSYRQLSIIMTVNTGFQHQKLNQYGQLDLKLRMGLYALKELHQIFSDRCVMAFPQQIQPSLVDFCFDFVTEFGFKVPGTYVNYLGEVYEMLGQKSVTDVEALRVKSQHLFEGYHLEIAALCDYVLESDLIVLLFLENLTGYFSQKEKPFIPYKDLYELYEISAELVEYCPKKAEFQRILQNFIDIALIIPSSCHCSENYLLSENPPPEVPYFIPMPIQDLRTIVTSSF